MALAGLCAGALGLVLLLIGEGELSTGALAGMLVFDAVLGAAAGDDVYTLAFSALYVGDAAERVLRGVTAGVGDGKVGTGDGDCSWMPGETVASGEAVGVALGVADWVGTGVALGEGSDAGDVTVEEELPVGAKSSLVLGASAGTSACMQHTVRQLSKHLQHVAILLQTSTPTSQT